MLLLVIPPVALFAGVSAWILWGPAIALAACGVLHGLTLVLCEVLLGTFTGAPMTRRTCRADRGFTCGGRST